MTLHESPAVNGFAPVAGPGATVLILGNAPSVLALAKQQYYGNPQNAFWRLMAELFGCPADAPYPDRCAALIAHGRPWPPHSVGPASPFQPPST